MADYKMYASAAHMWSNCPGSVILANKMPGMAVDGVKTAYDNTVIGKFAHTLAERALDDFNIETYGCEKFNHKTVRCILDSYDHDLKEEDIDILINYVMIYINAIYKLYVKMSENSECKIYIEKRVSIVEGVCYGLADCILFNGSELTVIDLKTGMVPVKAENNQQLACYLLGAFNSFDRYQLPIKFTGVIVQPTNDNPVVKYEYEYKDLLEFDKKIKHVNVLIKNYLAKVEKHMIIDKDTSIPDFDPDAMFNVGEHCKYCDALPLCKKAQNRYEKIIDDLNGLPEEKMNHESMKDIIKYKKIFNNLIDKCEQYAVTLLMLGYDVEGLELKRGVSRRKWKNQDDFLFEIPKELMPLCYNTVLKSPKQLSDIGVIDQEIIDRHCYKPEGKTTVKLTKIEEKSL